MGKIKRQGISSSIFLYIGMVLGFLNTGILFPKILPPEILGFAQFLAKTSSLFGIISLFGLPMLTIRFFPTVKNKEGKHDGYFGFILILGVISSLLMVGLLYANEEAVISFFTSNNEEKDILGNQLIKENFSGMLVWVFFNNLVILLSSFCTALQRPRVPAFFSEVFGRVVTTSLLVAFLLKIIDQGTFVTLYTLKPVPLVIGLVGFLILIGEFHWYLSKKLFLKNDTRGWLAFGSYAAFSQVGDRLTTSIDTIMITKYLNLANTGVYNVFQLICTTITMTHKGMGRIASPIIAEYWAKKELDKIQALYKRLALLNLIVALLMYCCILVNLDNAILFYNESYADGKWVAIFIGAAQVLHVLNGYNGMILVYSPLYRFELYFKIVTVAITVGSNLLLIQKFGIKGAALATAITVLITNILNQWFVFKSFKMHPFSKPMIKILLIAIIACCIGFVIPRFTDLIFLDVIIRTSILAGVYLFLVIYGKVSDDVNETFVQWRKKILGF